jgi:hypothetical protein
MCSVGSRGRPQLKERLTGCGGKELLPRALLLELLVAIMGVKAGNAIGRRVVL